MGIKSQIDQLKKELSEDLVSRKSVLAYRTSLKFELQETKADLNIHKITTNASYTHLSEDIGKLKTAALDKLGRDASAEEKLAIEKEFAITKDTRISMTEEIAANVFQLRFQMDPKMRALGQYTKRMKLLGVREKRLNEKLLLIEEELKRSNEKLENLDTKIKNLRSKIEDLETKRQVSTPINKLRALCTTIREQVKLLNKEPVEDDRFSESSNSLLDSDSTRSPRR